MKTTVQYCIILLVLYCRPIINMWNSLPDNVVASPSVCTFAKRLKSVDITKFAVLF